MILEVDSRSFKLSSYLFETLFSIVKEMDKTQTIVPNFQTNSSKITVSTSKATCFKFSSLMSKVMFVRLPDKRPYPPHPKLLYAAPLYTRHNLPAAGQAQSSRLAHQPAVDPRRLSPAFSGQRGQCDLVTAVHFHSCHLIVAHKELFLHSKPY